MTMLSVYINLSQTNNIEEELQKLQKSANLSPEELAQLVAATKVERKDQKEKKEQEEEAQFKKFLDNSPGRKDLTFDDYQKLLKLTRLAYVREHNGVPEEHAIKLLEAFGNYEAAIEYLKRYENANPSRPHLIHDACLFALPSDKYNVALWRELNRRYMPDVRYEKTLSLAPTIESYVSAHKEALEKLALREVYSDYEKRFGDEWEEAYKIKKETKSYDEYYRKHIEQLEKKITEMVNKQFSYEANKRITEQPDIFKDLDRSTAFEKFRDSEEGKKLWEELTENIRDKQEEALRKQYEKTQSANVAKQEYIANRLKKIKKKVIEGSVKDAKSRILSENTSIETLYHYLSQCSYKNAGQNPKAAALFFGYGVPEEEFDKWLALTPSSTSNIPNVFIDGAEIGYPGFYLKKLSKSDPTCAIAGKMTSCCQWMGGDGGACAIHAITSPNGDIYGLYQKRGAQPGDDDILLAQTWAWSSKNDNIVFDSIESQIDFRRKNERMLSDFFILLTHKLVNEQGISKVFLGIGASPEALIPVQIKRAELEDPKDHKRVGDSRFLSWISSPIFLRFYLGNNADSKLQKVLKELAEPKEQDIIEWRKFDQKKILLEQSLKQGNLAIVQFLFEKIWPEAINDLIGNKIAFTPILLAAKYNHEAIFDYLISKGAKVKDNIIQTTPIHLTSSVNILRKSIEHVGDIDAEDSFGTPLFQAIKRGNREQVDFLIQRGAQLKKGLPLLLAAIGNIEMTKYLIEKGFDINMKLNQENNTILHEAASDRSLPYLEFLLKDLKMDVNAVNYRGNTALLKAVRHLPLEGIKLLVEYGANINHENNSGDTALNNAIENGNIEIANFLLDHGADLHRKNKRGKSVIDLIHDEPRMFNDEGIKFALEKEKELKEKELKGKEPMPLPAFDLAKEKDKKEEKETPKVIKDHPKNS